jgi:creatinine amidohydrolase
LNSINLSEATGNKIAKMKLSNVTIILPLGATENHGPHLPFGADTIFTETLAQQVKERVDNAIILPPISYGESFDHFDFPVTITLLPHTLENLIFDILSSVAKYGVRHFLLINGHDGNRASISSAVKRLRSEYPQAVVANYDWPLSVYDHLDENFFEKWGGHGHAGESETSIFLHIRPDLVDSEAIPRDDSEPTEYHDGVFYWKIKDITPSGAEGAPRFASKEKGKAVTEKCVELIVDLLRQLDDHDWKPKI